MLIPRGARALEYLEVVKHLEFEPDGRDKAAHRECWKRCIEDGALLCLSSTRDNGEYNAVRLLFLWRV